MKEQDILKKIDAHAKGALQSLKSLAQKNITKIKQVGFKETLLSMGTPDEKKLLYSEVVKREKQQATKLTTKREETIDATKKSISKPKKVSENTLSSTHKQTSTTKINTEETKQTKTTTNKSIEKKSVTKKTTIKNPTETKKSAKKRTSTKSTASTKGSKRDEKIALYITDIKKHYGEVDESFVALIVKNLGPSIYRKNAERVSCSDPKELDTVRRNFLIKKLGIDASQGVLDAAIQDVCEELKDADTKYRATFYYALAKKFKKESVLS